MSGIVTASIADGIDRIVTLPVFNWDNMLARIPMAGLFDSLKTRYGQSPLTYAAEKLKLNVKKSDIVFITTGFYVNYGETLESDGPPGAATLARAISIGLRASPIMLVEETYVNQMKSICSSAGLAPYPPEKVKDGPHRIAIQGFPKDQNRAEKVAETLMRTFNPSALIAVECDDRNKNGIFHSASGFNISANQPKFPTLFDLANRSNVLTVGIGDFGNEIGMETLTETFAKLTPNHANCKCECRGGIVSTTKAQATIIANISNWGAYGLEAALALQARNPEVMHDPQTEIRVLEETARVGFTDPAATFIAPSADGATREVNANIVHLLRSAVELQTNQAFQEYLS